MKFRFLFLFFTIVAFAFFARFYQVTSPSQFYFDEVYHGFTATTFLHNDPKGYEYWQTPPEGVAYEWTHPPFAKLAMAGGMMIFGENSLGWRISSVLFGTGVIAMVGLLTYKLFGRKKIALLAMGLASLDGLLLSMSRIAMNDMHFLFFALLGIYWYIDLKSAVFSYEKKTYLLRHLLLTALAIGLALASKWTALYIGASLIIDFVFTMFYTGKLPLKKILVSALLGGTIVAGVYLGSYAQFFMQGHTLKQWKETTQQMWWYHTGLKATHPYQSRPLQWITDTRPVWMSVDYSANEKGLVGNIYNAGNPLLFWSGLTVSMTLALFALRDGIRIFSNFLSERPKKITSTMPWKLWFPLFLYGMLWIPWQFSPRIMFFYHYAPAVPFLCILLAYALVTLSERYRRFIPVALLLVVSISFLYFLLYPLNTGLLMQSSYFDTVFRYFPSWK